MKTLFIPFILFFGTPGLSQDDLILGQPLYQCWEININNEIELASDNEVELYISFPDGTLNAYNIPNRRDVWKSDLGGRTEIKPIGDKTQIFIVSSVLSSNKSDNYILRAISKVTGVTNWQTGIAETRNPFLSETDNGIFAVGSNGRISVFEKSKGQLLWNKNISDDLISIPYFSTAEIVLSTINKIIILSQKTGEILQTIDTREPALTLLLSGTREVFWGDREGNIYAFDVLQKRRTWRIKTGGRISSISEVSGGILVTSLDNYIYLYSKGGGRLIWKKRTAGRITERPLIVEKYAVVVGVGESVATVLNLESGRAVNLIVLESENYFKKPPVLADGFLIFQTSNSVNVYGSKGCLNK